MYCDGSYPKDHQSCLQGCLRYSFCRCLFDAGSGVAAVALFDVLGAGVGAGVVFVGVVGTGVAGSGVANVFASAESAVTIAGAVVSLLSFSWPLCRLLCRLLYRFLFRSL